MGRGLWCRSHWYSLQSQPRNGSVPSPQRAALPANLWLMAQADGHWDWAKSHTHHPEAYGETSYQACLWVVQCRAHSPARLGLSWGLLSPSPYTWCFSLAFLGPMGSQEVRGKALVQLLAAELGCRRPCAHMRHLIRLEKSLGVTASLSPPKRDPGRAGNSQSFGDGRIWALILSLSGDCLCDLGKITHPLWALVSSAEEWGTISYLVVMIKSVANFLTRSKLWENSTFYYEHYTQTKVEYW